MARKKTKSKKAKSTSSKQHPGTDWNTGLAGNPGLPLNRNAQAVANQTTVFAECTSLLRVMANKVIEVVQ